MGQNDDTARDAVVVVYPNALKFRQGPRMNNPELSSGLNPHSCSWSGEIGENIITLW